MQSHCQIPTPIEYVKSMLNAAGYDSNLFGKKVLENSCGEGNILTEIVSRYIRDCKTENREACEIAQGLSRDIIGYEVDSHAIEVCKDRLNRILIEEKIPPVEWSIYQEDYLKAADSNYQFIIGNPPYVTYHDLDNETRSFLRNNFNTCKNGRYDYFYAFTEKAYNALEDHGIMVYLIPFSVFRNKFAGELRTILLNDIVSIVDCSESEVFSDVTTSVAVIKIIKGSNEAIIQYTKPNANEAFTVKKSMLTEKWFFKSGGEGKRFGDHFIVKNSVATLFNKAFLITDYKESDDFVLVDEHRIEKELVREAVSTKSCKKQRPDLIIFPYKFMENGYKHFSEKEFLMRYPGASEYLKTFSEGLSKRKNSNGVMWFEYGRTQAINDVDGEKLIIPMVITTKVTAYMASSTSVPYAGYYIKARDPDKYDLSVAKTLLESSEFYEYVKTHGTPTTKDSYRISVKEIENFTFKETVLWRK